MNHNELSFNQLCGRLVADPETITTAGGKTLLKFAMAYKTMRSSDSEGSHTSFIEVEAWGKIVEIYQPLLRKGLQVVVNGELVQRRWKNKEGQRREKFILVASAITITDPAFRPVTQAA